MGLFAGMADSPQVDLPELLTRRVLRSCVAILSVTVPIHQSGTTFIRPPVGLVPLA